MTEGPLLIIAGPGSGKTYTLVERILHLVCEKKVAPENLFVVTFTDKAAQELTTRISNRLAEEGIALNLNEMYLGTIHSVCLRWLEEYREYTRLKRSFTLLDQFDQQYFFYQRLDQYRALEESEDLLGPPAGTSRWHTSETLVRWLNTVSEEALDPATLVAASHAKLRALGRCAALYHAQLEAENTLDFSTIQYEAHKLLRDHPDVLADLRAKLKYLMVDEYQDTNTIQEQILMLLAGPQGNICVVGDEDQGLYRFRGATIRNILEFPTRFPEGACRQVRLTVNYRSHPDIVAFYNKWMDDQNWEQATRRFRYDKTIEARAGDFPPHPVVFKVSANSQHAYHAEVLTFLQALREQGQLTDWNQVAFLYNSVKNDKAVALARFLEDNGIGVYSPRSNQFFEREEIRLLIGALIFLFPQFPNVRKWNTTAHLDLWDYYDQECFPLFAAALRDPANADLLKWCRTRAKEHLQLIENTDYAFTGLFYQLLRFPLFSRFLDDNLMHSGVQDQRAMRNLAKCSQLLGKFEYLHRISVITPDTLEKNLRDLFNQFLRYLKDGGIDEYEDETEYASSGCVSFLTVHQSKGLEFPVVIVSSLHAVPRTQYTEIDALLAPYLSRPAFEPVDQIKYYDFRRLYYTAFSRPQNILVLACQEVQGQGKTPSSSFRPYFDSLPDWRAGTINLAAVPLEQVKTVNLKKEYSFTSHLTLFENCAEQYRFYRELEFAPIRTSPILFGTLVHQTIEDIHKAVLRGDQSKLSPDKIEGWFDQNYAFLTRRERVYLSPPVRRTALEHVLRYYKRTGGDWSRIREAEVEVSLVKDQYILRGNVDLIRGKDDTVEIVDFKSERKPDVNRPEDRERISRYRRQLEVYAHIIEERYGLKISKTHLYYTSEEAGNPYITFDKDDKSLAKTIETFDRVVDRIEQKDFAIPERPAKLCPNCDMRHYCDTKNWKFRKQAP